MARRSEEHPDRIVLMMVDTQGANCVGAYGDRALSTPSIDGLAEQGLRFNRAYTCCPLCTPARGAMFTGTYPHTNGAWANELPLGFTIRHLGQRLRDAGVTAGYTGKWHLSATDYFDSGECPDGWEPSYWFDGRNHLESLPAAMRPFSREYHAPEEIRRADYDVSRTFACGVTDRAIRFLEDHQDEAFALIVSYDEPHHPSIAPPPFCDRFSDYEFEGGPALHDTLAGKPEHQRRWAEKVAGPHSDRAPSGRYRNPAYFACNSFVDSEVGRVIEAVDRLAPDALVIYTSDHGEMMFAHRLHSKGPAMYDEVTRVPFIVRWPGRVAAGGICDKPLSHIDLTPTMLDCFGVDVPPFLQGRSLLPRFVDPDGYPARPVFMEFHRMNAYTADDLIPIRCIFDGRYKLVLNLMDRDELYDLHADPGELTNHVDEPAIAGERTRLHQALVDWMQDTHDPFFCNRWIDRPWAGDARPTIRTGRWPRPLDGYLAPPLGYGTGRPMERRG